ncbi:VOC family protein [Lentisphaerota bacterium ZTH]|nr:VOC family protein [Lentisphaerota bacterium]WET06358.1 VOC family protein [Lentisphaerota bacterium ZTH]
MSSNIKFHSTAAFVRNIEVSKRFYTEVLGQKIELDFGKNVVLEGGMTLWEIWQNHIVARKMSLDLKDKFLKPRVEFCFETEDIQAVFEKLCEHKVEFIHKIYEEPWGQLTVRFLDPDRHLIEVGESLSTFINRLYKAGRTPEQVAEKTTVPVDVVKGLLKAKV